MRRRERRRLPGRSPSPVLGWRSPLSALWNSALLCAHGGRQRGVFTDQGHAALEHFSNTISRVFVVQPVNETALALAHALLDRHSLRVPDALQLGSCIALHQSQSRSELRFVCCDHELLRAAAAERVPNWNPAAAV